MINFIIQKSAYRSPEAIDKLCELIKLKNHNYILIKDTPFKDEIDLNFSEKEIVFFFGSTALARKIAKTKPWIPGVFCHLENFNCTKYYSHYGKYLFNNDYIIFTYAELKRKLKDILLLFELNENNWDLFIRPNDGFKSFTGQTINNSNYINQFQYLDNYVKPESLIIVSRAKNINKEYRFFINQKEIISGSKYMDNFNISESNDIPSNIINFTENLLKEINWIPENLFVIDVAENNEQIGLLEINSFSCSGFYKSDLNLILDFAIKESIREFEYINSI